MERGRPTPPLILTDDERQKLPTWSRRPTTARRLALRAKIVLACAEGLDQQQVASQLRTSRFTAGKRRARFLADRLAGLADEPRPGAPRKLTDDRVEAVVTRTLETKPVAATHRSNRSLAKAMGLSREAIRRVWRAFELEPHRSETFELSGDPFFVEKVRDIVGLYLNPPDRAIILGIDEESRVRALDRAQPLLPLAPGQAERHTHGYVRRGTTPLFAALDVAAGRVIGRCYRRHRHQEFLRFLKPVDSKLPERPGVEVPLVMDNYGTHKTPAVKRWLLRHPEYHLHFTPTGGSWLNQVERLFAESTEKMIRRGAFRSVGASVEAIRVYLEEHNRDPKPFVWTADADLILERVERFCERTSVSGH